MTVTPAGAPKPQNTPIVPAVADPASAKKAAITPVKGPPTTTALTPTLTQPLAPAQSTQARDATPQQLPLPVPNIIQSATAPRSAPTAVRAPDAPADSEPAGTLETLSKHFNIDIAKLPANEQAALVASYQGLTRLNATPADSDAFVRTVGLAMTHDRQSVLAPLAEKPEDELVRLAPAIVREATLLQTQRAAATLRDRNIGFDYMRRTLLTRSGDRDESLLSMKESDLQDPQAWAAFRKQYIEAAGGEQHARNVAGRPDRTTPSLEHEAMRYIDARDLLGQRGADGQTPLQRSTPDAIIADAKAQLVDLVRNNRELQAFQETQVEQMASAFTALGDPPAPGSLDRASFDASVRARMGREDIPVYPDPNQPIDRYHQISALSVFKSGVEGSLRGLSVADTKLANNDLQPSDVLPLMLQTQGALKTEYMARLASGDALDGLEFGSRVLDGQIAKANDELKSENRQKVVTAAVGGVAGVGLLLSGPLGWGAGITAGLATAGGLAAAKQMQLDYNDYQRQLRAGGIDNAGLKISDIEEADKGRLAAMMGMNLAGIVGGGLQTFSAVKLEAAAARVAYTKKLVDAMTAPEGAARDTAIAKFLTDTGVTGEHASAIASDLSALSAEKQAVATRLLERFGPETKNAQALLAMLRFAVANADVNNKAGAVANVDHMYKAYLAMNDIVAGQKTLTETDKTINMIATIGTDAQGKFGYESLEIIPTKLGDRTITTAAQHLQTVREQAFADVFRGAPDTEAMRAFRARFERDLVNEPDPGQRMKNFGAIMAAAKADPAVNQQLMRNMIAPNLQLRFLPFTEGAYIHNVVDPGRVYAMATEAGLSANAASAGCGLPRHHARLW